MARPVRAVLAWGLLIGGILTLCMALALTRAMLKETDFERQRIKQEELRMQLKFGEPRTATDRTQITTRTWSAEPMPGHAFNIVEITVADLQHKASGQVNFIGDTKPLEGTLEEKTHVYLCRWIIAREEGGLAIRPLVGNYYGGFASHREAVQLCNDVWRTRWRYLRRKPQIVRAQFAGPRTLQ